MPWLTAVGAKQVAPTVAHHQQRGRDPLRAPVQRLQRDAVPLRAVHQRPGVGQAVAGGQRRHKGTDLRDNRCMAHGQVHGT